MDAFTSAASSTSGKFVKFKQPGDEFTIQVTGVGERPDEYKGQPKLDKNGQQLMEQLIEGLDLNAASEAEAQVVLGVNKFRLRQSIGRAVLAAGGSTLQKGGTLRVVFTGYGVASQGNPPMEFEAEYWLPEIDEEED